MRRIPERLLVTSSVQSPFIGPGGGPGGGGTPFPRLRRFIKVSFHSPGGKIAGRGTIPFCPAGNRQRLSGTGPQLSRYPFSCSSTSLFTRGLVWGIDRDWATQPLDYGGPDPELKLKGGPYRVVAKITRKYRHMFGISSKDATARLNVVVRNGGGGPIPEPGTAKSPPAWSKSAPRGVPTVDNPPLGVRPDLAALPAWNIATDSPGSRDLLTFSATEWNAGPAALDIEGFRRAGHTHMRAYEYFHDRRGHIVGRTRAGGLEYDPRNGHHHWHLLQFARYTLLDASKHHALTSHKQSFCIAPTDLIDLTVPGADWGTDTSGFFTACGDRTSLSVRDPGRRLGRFLPAERRRAGIRDRQGPQRPLLPQDRGQPGGQAARDQDPEQRRPPANPDRRHSGPPHRARGAVARNPQRVSKAQASWALGA